MGNIPVQLTLLQGGTIEQNILGISTPERMQVTFITDTPSIL
jgi:hypothetical protein